MEGFVGAAPIMDWKAKDLPAAWMEFKEHASFVFEGPLSEKNETQKCSFLMLWVGTKGREIYKTFNMTVEEKKLLSEYYTRFESHVKPKTNRVFARYKFQARVQGEETFEEFVTDLKLLARDCGYHDPDEMVRDRIVFGVQSSRIREKLINQGSDLTLHKAIDIGQTYELSQAQLKTMAHASEVHALKSKKKFESKQSDKPKQADTKCRSCGYDWKPEHTCPAKGKECAKCHKLNHFAKVCRSSANYNKPSTGNKKIHTVDETRDCGEDDFFISALYADVNTISQNDEWFQDIIVADQTVTFQLDTGAKCNTITWRQFDTLNLSQTLEKSDTTLWSYTGHRVNVKGKTTLVCTYKDISVPLVFNVVEVNTHSVLSGEACKTLNLVKRLHAISELDNKLILNDCPELFEGLGCLPGKYSIKIDESVQPVVNAPRRVPVALHDRVNSELDKMEEMGVIVKQRDPTPWVNSMVTVVKSDKVRICLDPCDLNKAIKREHYPTKTIDQVAARIPKVKYFSRFDAKKAYWQIALDEPSSLLTTFNTPKGRYRFTRLPFGISSASEVFQRAMEEIFRDLEGVEIIHNDILVWAVTIEEHDKRLNAMLKRAHEAGLKFTSEKADVRVPSVKFVGHVLTDKGLKPTAEHVTAITEMPQPQNKEDLQRFLGLIQYLSKFLPNLAQEAAPLRVLLKKDIQWHWDHEQKMSFCKIKKHGIQRTNSTFLRPGERYCAI